MTMTNGAAARRGVEQVSPASIDALKAWLYEQIADDERDARDWASWADHESGTALGFDLSNLADRMLADCDMKRALIAETISPFLGLNHVAGWNAWVALRILARPYAERAGYRDEWRV